MTDLRPKFDFSYFFLYLRPSGTRLRVDFIPVKEGIVMMAAEKRDQPETQLGDFVIESNNPEVIRQVATNALGQRRLLYLDHLVQDINARMTN